MAQLTPASQKIMPCLWFDHQAEEAARFYTAIFKQGRILHLSPMVVTFELEGQRFMGLNGGPRFPFTEAVSFCIHCEDQQELDYFWSHLSEGGSESQCGWLKDKYGLSWQVIPTVLGTLMSHPDPATSQRVFQVLMGMKKIDISLLQAAYEGL